MLNRSHSDIFCNTIDRQNITALLAARSPQPHRSALQVPSMDEGKDIEDVPDSPLLLGQACYGHVTVTRFCPALL